MTKKEKQFNWAFADEALRKKTQENEIKNLLSHLRKLNCLK